MVPSRQDRAQPDDASLRRALGATNASGQHTALHRWAWDAKLPQLRAAWERKLVTRSMLAQPAGTWRRHGSHLKRDSPSYEVHPVFAAIVSPHDRSDDVVKFFFDELQVPVDMATFQHLMPIHAAIFASSWPKTASIIDRHRGQWLDTLPPDRVPALPVSTPLAWAAWRGKWDAVHRMVIWGASVNAFSPAHELLRCTRFRPITALGVVMVSTHLSQRQSLVGVDKLIWLGAALNRTVTKGEKVTPLGLAGATNMFGIIRRLVEAGADPTVENEIFAGLYSERNITWSVARAAAGPAGQRCPAATETMLALVAAGGTWKPTHPHVVDVKSKAGDMRTLLELIEGLWTIQRLGVWDESSAVVQRWEALYGTHPRVCPKALREQRSRRFRLHDLGRILGLETAGWLVRQAQYGDKVHHVPPALRVRAMYWNRRCKTTALVHSIIGRAHLSLLAAGERKLLPPLPLELVLYILSFLPILQKFE